MATEAKPQHVPDGRAWVWLKCYACHAMVGIVFGGADPQDDGELNGGGVTTLDGTLSVLGRPVIRCKCGHKERIRPSAKMIDKYAERL